MRYDVFLSHAGTDRDLTIQLKDELVVKQGLRVWIYEENVAAGSYRTGAQEGVLASGAAFVVVVSPDAATSEEVKYETSRAFALRIPRIPVYLNSAVARDEQVKGLLHVDAQNGVVLTDGMLTADAVTRVADIVRADLKARQADSTPRLPDGRMVLGRTSLIEGLVKELEERQVKVVVLYGPPGAGKSTLARAVIAALEALQFATASVFLSKDDKSFPDVVTRIQNALQLEADAGASVKIILSALAARVRRLRGLYLLIDNFEQVTAAARDELLNAVAGMPDVQLSLLITTRRRFDTTLVSAVEHSVHPLEYPSGDLIGRLSPERLVADYPAVALFLKYALTPVQGHKELERARGLDPETIRQIARLCEAHEGFPGAIEVAAKTFGRLGGLRRLLTKVKEQRRLRADSAETMVVAVRSTYDLLQPPVQQAFLQCAGFDGGFDDPAAAAVLGDQSTGQEDALAQLCDCGLLRRDPESLRWSLYLPILECAREISASGEFSALRQDFSEKHSAHFLELARQRIAANDETSRRELTQKVDADRDNLVLVIRRAIASNRGSDAGQLLVAVAASFRSRGPASVLLGLANEVDHCMDDGHKASQAQHAEVNLVAARAAESLGNYEEFLKRSKEAYQRVDLNEVDLRVRVIIAYIAAAERTGQAQVVRSLIAEMGDLIERKNTDTDTVCEGLLELVYIHERTEGRRSGEIMLDRATALAAKDSSVPGHVRWRLVGARGLLAWRDGDTSEAIDLFNKSLAMVDTLGLSDKYRGGSHTNLALALVDKNDFEHAAEHLILGREALERATDTGWLAVNYVADVNARMFVALRDQAHDTVAKRAAAADALRCLEQHEAFIRVNGYSQNVALMLALKGEALLWLDRHDEAESTLLEARRCCRELAGVPTFERWFRVSMLLAEIAAARFDIDAAAAFLRDAKEFVQKRELAKRTFPVRRIAWLYERYCELCRRLKIEA